MARTHQITQREEYIESLYCPNKEKFENIRNSAGSNYPIQISPSEAQFITVLIKMHGSKYALELGSLVGYSTAHIASSLPEDGVLTSVEINKDNHEKTKDNLSSLDLKCTLNLINEDAVSFLESHEFNHMLDCVFIDAKKDQYVRYLELVYPKLRQGGLIIADNTFLFDKIFDEKHNDESNYQVMKEFNNMLADSSKYHSIIVPTQEGLTIALKK